MCVCVCSCCCCCEKVHDLSTMNCNGSWLVFAADIYEDDCYVINVTDPANPVTLLQWPARMGMAHNIWMDDTCSVAYVTHEEVNM